MLIFNTRFIFNFDSLISNKTKTSLGASGNLGNKFEVYSILFYFIAVYEIVFREFALFVIIESGLLWQDDFVLGKKLGEGSFGVVYKVTLANKSSSKV